MALRADNFASPTAATFEVLDDDILMVSGSGTIEWSNWTDATIQIPREKTVTSGTLIGIYDLDALIDEFMVETQVKSLSEEGKPTWTITGPQINGLLAKIDVRPQDYPVKPTIVRDWIWAGQNLLANPGMEDSSEIAEIYEIDLDGATSGDFTLTVGGDTTPSQQWDVSEANLETAIEALTGTPPVVDVDVDAQSDGYRIEFADPATLDTAMTWVPNLSGGGGDEELNIIQAGDNTQPPVWTRSQFLDSGSDPKLHGTYASDGFRLTKDAEPVDTGNFALRVNGLTQYSGAQQVVNVIPGQTYQASVRMYTSNTGPATEIFKLVLRDARNHKYLVSTSTSISDNTWTTISLVDFVVPAGVTQIIFRIASVVDQNPSPWYFDNAVFAEGFAAATPGEIIRILLEAAQLRSVGLWIDPDFSDTIDQLGTSWGAPISFRAFPPQTLAHVMEGLHQLGVNWYLERKATPSGALTHDLKVYAKDSAPDLTSTVEILAVQDATVKDRLPAANSRIAYGDEGLWDELDDASAITSFGKWEGGYDAQHLMSEAALAVFLSDIEDEEQTNRLALQATMHQGDEYGPLSLFRPGDIVEWQFPGIQPSVDKPVRTISWEQGDIARFQITGSKVFDDETGLARAVEFLLDEIKPRARLELQGNAPLPVGGVGSGGGVFTYTIAASDASVDSKNKADIVCTGVNDQDIIQTAIDTIDVELTGSLFQGWKLVFSEGLFDIDVSGGAITGGTQGMTIEGAGKEATLFAAGSSIPTGDHEPMFDLNGRSTARDFAIEGGTGGVHMTGIRLLDNDVRVENILFSNNGYGVSAERHRQVITGCNFQGDLGLRVLGVNTTHVIVTDNWFSSSGIGVEVIDADRILIIGNTFENSEQHGVSFSGTNDSVITGNIIYRVGSLTDNTYDGIILSADSNRNHIFGNSGISHTAGNQIRYFINISASDCDDNRIGDNSYGVLTDYGTHPLNDLGTGTKYPTARTGDMSKGGTLSIAAGVAFYPFAEPSIYLDAHATAGGAPSGGPVTVDINKNGSTSIYTTATNPSIASGTNIGSKAPGDPTLFVEDEYISLDLDAVNGATDFTCVVRFLVG